LPVTNCSGGGVELTPDNGFKISALYGRLKKASSGEDGTDPAYKRMGGGIQVEYTGEKFDVAVDVFKQKNNSTSRIIYSGNISSNITEKFSLGVNFSNLQSYIYINDVYSQVTQTNEFQNLDTLNVTQLNYTASLNSSYLLQSTKEKRQSVNLNFMYQKSAEAQKYSRFSGNDIYNTSASYQFSVIPLKLNASASVNHNYNQMPENVYTQAMTYNVSLQKTFFEELKSALTATYSQMSNQSGKLSNVLNLRLSEGYLLAKRHNFNLSLTMLYSEAVAKTRLQYAVNLSYSYAFNIVVSRKEKKIRMDANF
jgi:predicted transcriptional regulator